jgi:hypothetical protein
MPEQDTESTRRRADEAVRKNLPPGVRPVHAAEPGPHRCHDDEGIHGHLDA